jgi:hypothetical protein
MSAKHVKVIKLDIEERSAGIAVATSPNLPDFYLVTKHDRLDEDVPAALEKFYRIRLGQKAEIVPIDAGDELPTAQWAAILASGRNRVLA